MSAPLFTIATITYNSEKWVRQAIESVLASSYADFEFLIADDCSTDNTWDAIQEYNDPRIRSWRNEQNIGEYPNRNKVLSEASGKYLYFVDGDDILYKHTLRNLSEYIDAFPNAIMIWGVPSANIDFAVLPYQFDPEITMRLIYETTIPLATVGFSETVFRINDLRRIGYLPTSYAIGDTYIKKRLALEGPVLMVPMGFAFWRRSDSQASLKASRNFKGFIESFLIDLKIIEQSRLQNKEKLLLLVKGSFIRRMIKHTILKGRFHLFFLLFKVSGLTLFDFRFVLKRYGSVFSPASVISQPLINHFHFYPFRTN
jgi:glycosyltransferase involved in cell wall biosynthesis